MNTRTASLVGAALLLGATTAWAKLPTPPPVDPAAKAAADEKKKDAADKAKAELAAAEERTVKNFQENMRKEGKPVPKPVPVAAQSTPAKGAAPKPQANTAKLNGKT